MYCSIKRYLKHLKPTLLKSFDCFFGFFSEGRNILICVLKSLKLNIIFLLIIKLSMVSPLLLNDYYYYEAVRERVKQLNWYKEIVEY